MIKLKSLLKEQSADKPYLTLESIDIDANHKDHYRELIINFRFKVHNFQHRLIDITEFVINIDTGVDNYGAETAEEYYEHEDEEPTKVGYWTGYVTLEGYKGRASKAIPGTAMPQPGSAGPGHLWYENDTSNDIILPKIEEMLNAQNLVPGLKIEWIMTSEAGMQDDEVIHCDVAGEWDKLPELIQKYFDDLENGDN
jgi:hypothetical protein